MIEQIDLKILELKYIRARRNGIRRKLLEELKIELKEIGPTNNIILNHARRKAQRNYMADLTEKRLIEILTILKSGEYRRTGE